MPLVSQLPKKHGRYCTVFSCLKGIIEKTQTFQRCGRMWQHHTEERLSDRSDLELSFLGVSPQNRSEKSWDRSWNPLASLSAWRWGRLFQRVLERCKSMLTSATMLSACRGCSAARWAGTCNVWEWNLKPGDSQWEARPRLDWELEPTWCDRWVQ